ncbi:hypothetical protein [Haloarcula amylovorans]|uniref:hypothetical protein n=1 Tax=Haloarcula amylovorans TaxID=2562280 RepID=UPI001075D51A|nr:hypothetical protein [Halomicroarcula amylolytica]
MSALIWTGIVSIALLSLPISAITVLAVVIGYDRVSPSVEWFSQWPHERRSPDLIVSVIGYLGVVALSTLVAVVAYEITRTLAVGMVVASLSGIWFFKHLHFFLSLDSNTEKQVHTERD